MHLDGMGETLEEPYPRFSYVRLQKQTAGTIHGCTCDPRVVPCFRPGAHAFGGWGVATRFFFFFFFDRQLPVPRAGPVAPRPRPHFRRTGVTCFETPPHRRRIPPTYLSLSLSERAVPSLRFPSAGSGATFPFRLRVPERSGRPDRGSGATAVGLAMAELVQGQSAPVGMKAEGFVDALHRVRQVRAREAGGWRPPREASGGRLGPRVAGGPGGSLRRPGAGGSLSRALLAPARPAATTGLLSGVQVQAAPGGPSGVDPGHPSHALDVASAALGNLVFHLLHFKHIGRNSRIFYI